MPENTVTTTLRDVLGDLSEPQKELVIDRMVKFMRSMPQTMGANMEVSVTGCITNGYPRPGARLAYNLNDLAAYVAYGFK